MIDKEKSMKILGLDLSQIDFNNTPNIKPSFEDVFIKTQVETKYNSYLKENGFSELLKKADPKFRSDFAKTLMSAESRIGKITLDSINDSKIVGLIRSKETEANLLDTFEHIISENKTLDLKPIQTNIPYKKLHFNKAIEGKYAYTHNSFDTEADNEGHAIVNTAVNYEAHRIVVGYKSDEFKLDHFCEFEENQSTIKWHVYYLGTENLWEACLLADIETLIGAVLTSSLEQGSIETLSLYEKLFTEKVTIDIQLLTEVLNNQRKSIWICHNNFYDINQLNTVYKYNKGKRKDWNIVKTKELEFIKIRYDTQDSYTVKLGNTQVGFRFNAKSNTRWGFNAIPQLTLAPYQSQSFSFVTGIDTLTLASAGQFPNKTLKELSKGLEYEKIDLNERKIFSAKDLELSDESITEKVRYNIVDCLATLSVYSMLSYHFNLEELGKLLDIDCTKTKDWHKPFLALILSPASIAKFVIDLYLQSKTGLSRHEIEANFDLSRQYLSNFTNTYMGGRTEAFVFKKVLNEQERIIKYFDFESQYPTSSRIVNADLQLQLAAKGLIHEFLDYNTQSIMNDFWETLELTLNHKKNFQPLPDSFSEKILGNVTFTFVNLPLMIRAKISNRLQDVMLEPSRIDNAKLYSESKARPHIITTSLFDLLASCEYAVLVDKISLRKIKENIKFLSAERLVLGRTAKFGEEFFTKILKYRREFQYKLENETNSFISAKLKTTEQNLKYVMNSAYGITAEGISKDFLGKYQIPSIASLITACSRYLNYSAEILYRINGGVPIYSDTDSIIALADPTIHNKLINFFNKTIPLKEETKYGEIKAIHVLGKKKYGILTEKGEIHCKIHGTGAYRDTELAYKKMYELLLTTNKEPDQIARETVKLHPVFQSISFRKEKDSKIKGIIEFLKKGEIIQQYDYNDLNLYIYQLNEDYLIINTKKLSKGQFGNYLNLKQFSTAKVVFSIFAPCDFMSIVKFILEKPEFESKIIRKIKYRYPINTRIAYSDLEPIINVLNPSYDPYIEAINENPFDTINNTYFSSFFDRQKRKLGEALKLTFEQLSRITLNDKITKDDWESIGYAFIEEKITPEEFIETFSIHAKMAKLVDLHMDYLIQKDLISVDLYAQATEKRKLREKFIRLIEYNQTRFHRQRKESKTKTFDILLPKKFSKRITNKKIIENVNNEKFTCDGFTYAYSVNLPALDFSANLLSDQNKYYSQAIINGGLTASNIWVDTHFKQHSIILRKKKAFLTEKKENLPCPKSNKNVLIPLKIQLKIKSNVKFLDKEDWFLLFDKPTRKMLRKHGTIQYIRESKQYQVKNKVKFQRELKKLYSHEWIEIDWIKNKKWSISIEKRQSLDYNAMLSLKIVVNQSELGKRTFQCGLRLNPSSKNLYNIDLFSTSVKELDENAHIGKHILMKLFDQSLLTYFDQKRATHIEDITEATEPYEAYKTTYLTLAAHLLKKRMQYLRVKLGINSYTKNIKTVTPVKDLVPILSSTVRDMIQKQYDRIENPLDQLKKMEEINVSVNRFSLGFNINNYAEKFTVSVYGKDYYQYLSKLKRITKHEKMRDLPAKKLAKIRHLRDIQDESHTLRIEITIRGWEQIHTKSFYRYLDEIEKLIRKVDLELSLLDPNDKTRAENNREIKTRFERGLTQIEERLTLEMIECRKAKIRNKTHRSPKFEKQHKISDFS